MAAPLVEVAHVNHWYGSGEARRQVLCDVSVRIEPGEIVILTGPSGSGKTTLLTLVGALRSAQDGSVRVLDHELRGARARTLTRVRREIGYIFQTHNLIESLSARQNVQMAVQLGGEERGRAQRARAAELLDAVGLGDRADAMPAQMSGGQKQRVAIARALARSPRLVLADEPTASLDRRSGRDVVALMQSLAREQGVAVVLVTHDSRILDVADRIVHLEDGVLRSFGDAVVSQTEYLLQMLAEHSQRGALIYHVAEMPDAEFGELLGDLTETARQLTDSVALARAHAFDRMLEQVLEAFTRKIGDILGADRASLFLLDPERGELWSKVARDAEGKTFEIRIPSDQGVAGHVLHTGEDTFVPDAYADPRFDPTADRMSGYRTRNILCVPLRDATGVVFGVAQLLNKVDGTEFDDRDAERYREFMSSMGIILESWWRMSRREA